MKKTLMVSVSGIRGVVGETLTPKVIEKFSSAFFRCVSPSKIVVGRDPRFSGTAFEHILVGNLLSLGCDVIRLGICPTPTVGMAVKHLNADGGVVISASHNDLSWNALKLMNKTGRCLNVEEFQTLKKFLEEESHPYVENLSFGSEKFYTKACQNHIDKVIDTLDVESIRARKFTVALDSVNGAGAKITVDFLKSLGCSVLTQNCDVTKPFPRDPEPNENNLKNVSSWVENSDCDIAFVQDPDADRLAIIDPQMGFLKEEMTLALALESVLNYRKVSTPFVTNVSSTLLLDNIVKKYGVPIIKTKVGEAHVVKEMLKNDSIIGGEGNGGVIFAPTYMGRDSLVGIGLILELLAKRKSPLRSLIESWPKFFMVKDKVSYNQNFSLLASKCENLFSNPQKCLIDGVKYIENDMWLQLRASNTEPILRVFAEGPSEDKVKYLIRNALKILKNEE
ncbi:phosphoglucosamine mutase [PVC group bacterium (ex Bugula neritina AB1)]|nr:phosphoglucosamine mutase [PVC group bacterium (ex Bugula neritina AB1)]